MVSEDVVVGARQCCAKINSLVAKMHRLQQKQGFRTQLMQRHVSGHLSDLDDWDDGWGSRNLGAVYAEIRRVATHGGKTQYNPDDEDEKYEPEESAFEIEESLEDEVGLAWQKVNTPSSTSGKEASLNLYDLANDDGGGTYGVEIKATSRKRKADKDESLVLGSFTVTVGRRPQDTASVVAQVRKNVRDHNPFQIDGEFLRVVEMTIDTKMLSRRGAMEAGPVAYDDQVYEFMSILLSIYVEHSNSTLRKLTIFDIRPDMENALRVDKGRVAPYPNLASVSVVNGDKDLSDESLKALLAFFTRLAQAREASTRETLIALETPLEHLSGTEVDARNSARHPFCMVLAASHLFQKSKLSVSLTGSFRSAYDPHYTVTHFQEFNSLRHPANPVTSLTIRFDREGQNDARIPLVAGQNMITIDDKRLNDTLRRKQTVLRSFAVITGPRTANALLRESNAAGGAIGGYFVHRFAVTDTYNDLFFACRFPTPFFLVNANVSSYNEATELAVGRCKQIMLRVLLLDARAGMPQFTLDGEVAEPVTKKISLLEMPPERPLGEDNIESKETRVADRLSDYYLQLQDLLTVEDVADILQIPVSDIVDLVKQREQKKGSRSAKASVEDPSMLASVILEQLLF